MILVTGGTGMTGQFVAEELVRRGHGVRMLCRPGSPARPRLPGVEVVHGDLNDAGSLVRAASGTTGIVHAACTYTDSAVDIHAMRALLGAWGQGSFVYLSSLDVYGFAAERPIVETTPLGDPINDYSFGKAACERLLADHAAQASRRDFVSLRAPYIWGPHPTARKRLLGPRIPNHEAVVLPGADPSAWEQFQDAWVDVRDLAVIIAESLDRPAAGPLNVLTGHFTWHDLYADLIGRVGSRSRIIHKDLAAITDAELPNKEVFAQTWRFSEARLEQVLGVIPRRALAETIEDTLFG